MNIETNSTPDDSPEPEGRRIPPLPIIGALIAVVVIGVALVIVALSSGGGGGGGGDAGGPGLHAGLQTEQPTPEATIDLNRPSPTVLVDNNLTAVSNSDRFIISKFGVNAPLTYRAVGPDGQMPNPDGPDDIAYYNFSAWPGKGGAPGKGGNAVFAGHVDSGAKACKNGTVAPPCQAVLWDLNRLRLGDEVEILLGGVSHKYKVTSNQPVPANNAPWDTIVSATPQETITIITCGGDFNRQTNEYTTRQVVTATKMA